MHAASASTTLHSAASSMQGCTTGESLSHQHQCIAGKSVVKFSPFFLAIESTRSLRAHGSVGGATAPASEKATPLAAESVGGGSTLRKVKTPVRHTAGKGLFVGSC